MMKAEWDFETAGGLIAAAGVGVAALGGILRVTSLGLVGLVIVGVGVGCWGISGLAEGRILFFRPGVRHTERYYGWAARAWGALLCMAGMALAGFGLLSLLWPDVSLEKAMDGSVGKGAGMFLGGLVGVCYSVTLILGRAEDGGAWWRRMMKLPLRFFGVLLLLASILIAASGAMRALAPKAYEGIVRAIGDNLPRTATK